MTTVYTSFIYLDSRDPSINNGNVLTPTLHVRLSEAIPVPRHSVVFLSVHSLNIPIANSTSTFVPIELRVTCGAPSTVQSSNNFMGCLASIQIAQHIAYCPGLFSTIVYNNQDTTQAGVQLLDPLLNAFSLSLTDGSNKLFLPSFPYNVALRVEVKRNYQAEQVEQLNKLVAGQRLLLYQQHLVNYLDVADKDPIEVDQDIYQPGDTENIVQY